MRRVKGWMSLQVTKIVEETADTYTFWLVDAKSGQREFDYLPGQYLTLRLTGLAEKPVVRSYTMSSSPCQEEGVALTVKRVPGGLVSNWLPDQLKVGDCLSARGPIGRFITPFAAQGRHLVLVGAGSGVTPFLSMIREFVHNPSGVRPEKITLLVAQKTPEDQIMGAELDSWQHPHVTIVKTYTRIASSHQQSLLGRPDGGMLDQVVAGNYEEVLLMVCGPVPMMNLLTTHARHQGVKEEWIFVESFD